MLQEGMTDFSCLFFYLEQEQDLLILIFIQVSIVMNVLIYHAY